MLFNPLQVGALTLPNRVILAPLTRTRAGMEHLPNDLMAEYYAQRASGGLLITECTMVAPGTSAFINEPGIYSDAQIAAWKLTTDAVHAKGGRIFMQIWHAGRAAHPGINGGARTVSSSAPSNTANLQCMEPEPPRPFMTRTSMPASIRSLRAAGRAAALRYGVVPVPAVR